MATLSPPTEQDMLEYEDQEKGKSSVMPFDPLEGGQAPVYPEGETPTIPAIVENRPASETGKFLNVEGESIPARGLRTQDPSFISKMAGTFARGFNDIILPLPDAVLNGLADFVTFMGKANPEDVDSPDKTRNYLNRLFNSGDYEAVQEVVPYLLSMGVGKEIGPSSDQGFILDTTRAAGQGTALSTPFIGLSSKVAPLTAGAGNVVGQTAAAATKTPIKLPFNLGQFGNTANVRTALFEGMFAPYASRATATAATEATLGGVAAVGQELEDKFSPLSFNTGLGALGLASAGPGLFYATKTLGSKIAGFLPFSFFGKALKTYDEFKVAKGDRQVTEGELGDETVTKASSKDLKKLGDEYTGAVQTESGKLATARSGEITEKIDVALTPAEITLDAPLLKTQSSAEKSGTPEFARANEQRKVNNLAGIKEFVQNRFTGDALEDGPLAILDTGTKRVESILARVDKDSAEVTSKLAKIAEDALPTAKVGAREQFGTDVRASLEGAIKVAKQDADAFAKKLKINDSDQWSGKAALAQAQENLLSGFKFTAKDGTEEGVKGIGTRAGDAALGADLRHPLIKRFLSYTDDSGMEQVSFQNWKSFRGQISDALGTAIAKENSTDIQQLSALAKAWDTMGKTPRFKETTAKFEEFQDHYLNNVILPFQSGIVQKVLTKGKGSQLDAVIYKTSDESVADAFLKDSTTAQKYMELFSDDPAKVQAIQGMLLDKAKNVGFNATTGKLNPEALNKFANSNESVIRAVGLEKQFFGGKTDKMKSGPDIIRSLLARQKQLSDRRAAITKNRMFRLIKSADQKGQAPEVVLAEALNPKNPAILKQLYRSMKKENPLFELDGTLMAFRASIMDTLMGTADDAVKSPAAFKGRLEKIQNSKLLNGVFSQSHLDDMMLVADAYERVLATGIGEGGAGITNASILDALSAKIGTSIAGLANLARSAREGRVSGKAAAAYVASRAFSAQQSARADELFRRMMFDPELAKLMTAQGPSVGAISPAVKARLNAYMFSLGVDYGEDVMSEEAAGPDLEQIQMQPSIQFELPDVDVPTMLPPTASEDDFAASFAADPFFNQNATNSTTSAPIQMASAASPKTSVTQLFPFDSTGAAIESRQNQKQQNAGIMSLPR